MSEKTMENEEKVLVMPVEDYSFSKAKSELIYAFPKSYGLTVPDYMAFYRKRPVSAVTHYGKVKTVSEKDPGSKYRLMCFGNNFEEKAVLVEFENIKTLDKPVKSAEGQGIQGSLYTTLTKIKESSSVVDLFNNRK